ncbi:predicted protein [Histoplasma capsulatum var. duboisii H88]|uniref:Predicted protein n=2 Tax=Ajellomyces capsulatus TaxID=5037 RepID=F0UBT2_AJEC8|nr:predicted protein [Histoplasma capsulatum H143]EGC43931.1 predicted protein [Histoplasma capsulatum var. duboisii H88]
MMCSPKRTKGRNNGVRTPGSRQDDIHHALTPAGTPMCQPLLMTVKTVDPIYLDMQAAAPILLSSSHAARKTQSLHLTAKLYPAGFQSDEPRQTLIRERDKLCQQGIYHRGLITLGSLLKRSLFGGRFILG